MLNINKVRPTESYTLISIVILALLFPAIKVYAQDQALLEPPSIDQVAEASPDALEEVLVTAQRRVESLQDVAISISVMNEEQIANANMTNASDLAIMTPSLSANTRFGNENTSFSIRGFTQTLRTSATVGTYFADVIAPRGQSAQTAGDGAGPGYFFDLANVQVLKGPQGTLFGRNTTGGAVLLVPNRPEDTFKGYVQFTKGNFDAKRATAVLNVPFDTIRFRLGIDSNERDGHIRNTTGIGTDKLGNTDYVAVRLGILWDITETLENYTLLNHVDSETFGITPKLSVCNQSTDFVKNAFWFYTRAACNRQLALQEANNENGFYDAANTAVNPLSIIKEKRLINTTTWALTDNVSLKNILAYAHLLTDNTADIFGTNFQESDFSTTLVGMVLGVPGDPNRLIPIGNSIANPDHEVTRQTTWVEEIQLQGISEDTKLEWQMGLYFERSLPDGFSGNNAANFIFCDQATVISNEQSKWNCYDPLNGLLGSVMHQNYKNEWRNRAAYMQMTYDIVTQLSVTGGFRYTVDESKGHGVKTLYTYNGTTAKQPITSVADPRVKSEAPTGLVELQYRPFDDVMTYLKYVRGYRQGGVILAADRGLDEFEPEYVTSYEFGAKTQFELLRPIRFNFALFDNKLRDMQIEYGYVSSTAGPTTTIANAGEARIKGYEFDTLIQLLDNLVFTYAYTKLDTELIEQNDLNASDVISAVTDVSGSPISGFIAGFAVRPIAAEGDPLPYASETSWTASLNYTLPLPFEVGEVSVGATYIHSGETPIAATGSTPTTMLPSYDIVNVNASWTGVLGSNFDVSVFGTNVRDEEYVTYISGTYQALGYDSIQVGMPKVYGMRIKYNFGE